MSTQISASELLTARDETAFVDPETLPWKPWVMPGTHYRLMSINPITGGFCFFLEVDPNTTASVHGHTGAVDAYIIRGGFGYGEDRGRAGWFTYEIGGVDHQPNVDEDGMLMFAVVHAPLKGYNEDGSLAAVIDARFMYEKAMADGVGDHIPRPKGW